VATLTDYLDTETLQQVQDTFALVTRAELRIYGNDETALTGPTDLLGTGSTALKAAQRDDPPDVTIEVAGETLGRIVLERPSRTRWPAEQMSALAAALDIPMAHLREALQRVPTVDSETHRSAVQMLALMREVIRRLCDQEHRLRARMEELATVYRLTALFTDQRDLDTVLDTVVRTVVEAMGVKACGLRLLNRQTNELTIAAVVNLSPEYLDKGTILLTDSVLDAEVLRTGEVVYVADERTDPRVLYPEQCRREGIVSALIVPLTYKGGPVGALRLYTAEQHAFDPFEVAMVKAIAAQAAAAIVNAKLYAESLAAAEARRQLRLAGVVQRRMIPSSPPDMPGLDVGAVYAPSLDLSGDFYDFIALPEGNLGVAICDVMGKGLPASLLMASTRASLRAQVGNLYGLSEIMRRVNRGLCDDTLTNAFATLFYGIINTRSKDLTYANAGHERPLLVRGGKCHALGGGGMVLGIDRSLAYSQHVFGLIGGDVLVLTTDGVVDAMDFQQESFGQDRLQQAVLTAADRGDDANGIAKHVLWAVRRFAGLQEQTDDITLVIIRIL